MHCSLFFFAATCIAFTAATCTLPSTGKAIPEAFKKALNYPIWGADIEIYDTINKNLVAGKVAYDSANYKAIRATTVDNQVKQDIFYFYADNLILTYEYPKDAKATCLVISGKNLTADIMTAPTHLQPFSMEGKDSAGNAIRTKYFGKVKIRNKQVDKFMSCQKMQAGNGGNVDVTVEQYFSDPTWTYPEHIKVPVMIRIFGDTIGMSYSYFNFKPRLDPSTFQTPGGIDCKGRKSTVPFPKVPTFFKWNKEQLDRPRHIHTFVEEIYDLRDNVYILRQPKTVNSFDDMNSQVKVFNFKSGLVYELDSTGFTKCTVKNISDTNYPIYTKSKNGAVSMANSLSLFLDDKKNYVYLGQQLERNVLVDRWGAEQNVHGIGLAYVEWYFAQKGTKSWNDNMANGKSFRIPLKSKIWPYNKPQDSIPADTPFINSKQIRDPAFDINYFRFDYTDVIDTRNDLSDCLRHTHRNFYQIVFKGIGRFLDGLNMEDIKWSLIKQIAKAGQVQWLHVSHFWVNIFQDDFYATFNVLDESKVVSNIPNRLTIPSMDRVRQNIVRAVNNGDISLTIQPLKLPGTTKTFDAEKTNLKFTRPWHSHPAKSVSYSPGAMAGLGIAMLVIGAGSGGGVAFFLMVKKGMFS